MKKAIILFNLGGPDRLGNAESFLFNLFNDPAILNLPGFLRFPLAKLISKRMASTASTAFRRSVSNTSDLSAVQNHALRE